MSQLLSSIIGNSPRELYFPILELMDTEIKVYLLIVVPIASLIFFVLLRLLRNLVDKQVDDQLSEFTSKAKIPKIIANRIGVKIRWR